MVCALESLHCISTKLHAFTFMIDDEMLLLYRTLNPHNNFYYEDALGIWKYQSKLLQQKAHVVITTMTSQDGTRHYTCDSTKVCALVTNASTMNNSYKI